jgi:hypothetical protein
MQRFAMLGSSSCLFAASMLFVGCGSAGESAPPSSPPATGATPQAISAPFDVHEVVNRVSRSYRLEDDGSITGSRFTYAARGVDGHFEITPRHWLSREAVGHKGQPVLQGAPLTLETISIARADELKTERAKMAVDREGVLRFEHGLAEERFVNQETGVEQMWVFPELPRGEGDLVVRVAVNGERYAGFDARGHHFIDETSKVGVVYGPATWVDGTGQKTPISVAFAGGVLQIVVPASLVDKSVYPATIDPTVGAEFGITNPASAPSSYPESNPAIAYDGTNFFVVWQDTRNGANLDIFGARVNASGTVLDVADIGLVTRAFDQTSPSIAFNGTNYLVVYTDDRNTNLDVFGQVISTAGALVGSEITIASGAGNQQSADVAAQGTSWFVAWQDDSTGTNLVHAAYVSSGGSVGASVTMPGTAAQTDVAVACDPTNCLAIWADATPGFRVPHAARVSTAPAVLDNPTLNLKPTQGGEGLLPDVAFDGTRYMAVWQDYRFGDFDIYAGRITTAGVVVDTLRNGLHVSQLNTQEVQPAISFDGVQYVITWSDGRHSSFNGLDIFGARMTTTGTLTDTAGFGVGANINDQTVPAIASGGGQSLAAWADARTGATLTNTYGARISQAAAVSPDNYFGTAIGVAVNRQVTPAVAFDGTYYLLVWTDSRTSAGRDYDLIGARVYVNGTVIDPGGLALVVASGNQLVPDIVWNGSQYMLVWMDTRNGSTNADIFGTRINNVYQVLDGTGFTISSASGNQSRPTLAFNSSAGCSAGGCYLVTWGDERNGSSNRDIFGARVTTGGAVLDSSGIAINISAGNQSSPAVASNNTQWLVTWQDARNGSGTDDIHASLLGANGSLLNPDVTVASAANMQETPRVAFNTNTYVVVWDDFRNSLTNADIFAQRLDVSANLQGANVALASTANSEFRPNIVPIGPSEFFIVWRQEESPGGQVFDLVGQEFTGTLGAVQSVFTIAANSGNADRATIGVVTTGLTAVFYQEFVGGALNQERVRGRVITFP